MGINGLVKNMTDGSVYVEAEGDLEVLIHFLEWCKQGPPMARVENMLTVEGPMKGYANFTIVP